MDTVSVIEDTIKNHPMIDFDNRPGLVTEHWALCPCGYATKRFKTKKSAHKAFDAHVAEEVNEALMEAKLLVLNEEAARGYRGRSFVPTAPPALSFA